MRALSALALAALSALSLTVGLVHAPAPSVARAGEAATRTQEPLAFVENRGQWASSTRFAARRGGLVASFHERGIALRLCDTTGATTQVDLRFEGAEAAALEGSEPLAARHHFVQGNDPARWRSDVPGFAGLVYRGLYAGVDLRVREERGFVAYDLELAPDAALERVALVCSGVRGLALDGDGGLVLETELGPLRQPAPVAWHELECGGRAPRTCRYRLLGDDRFGFEVEGREPALALVIDPPLEWSTYSGGVGLELCSGLALAPGGSVVIAGYASDPFVGLSGKGFAKATAHEVSSEVYVRMLASDGGAVRWTTYLGGSGDEFVRAIALHPSGDIIIAGETASADFPTTPYAFARTSGGSDVDDSISSEAFVARIDASGSALVFSTYLGGASIDRALALAVEPSGVVVVAGETASPNFPTTAGALQATFAGGSKVDIAGHTVAAGGDAFVARLSADGSELLYASFLGGSGDDEVTGVAVDEAGGIALVGGTGSDDFPTTAGAFDRTFGGALQDGSFPTFSDVFVARIAPGGGALVYSTYFGGAHKEWARAIALDRFGAATIAGSVEATPTEPKTPRSPSAALPLAPPPVSPRTPNSPGAGGAHTSAPSLGPPLAGTPQPAFDFPVTPGAYDPLFSGGSQPFGGSEVDGFVARLSPDGSTLELATFLGGSSGADYPLALALDGSGAAIVTGDTGADDFPTTASAYDQSFNGGDQAFYSDVFVAQLSADGSRLVYATLLGGELGDGGRGIALDPTGAATIAGVTQSLSFPITAGAAQVDHGGARLAWQGFDAFAARLSLVAAGVERFGAGTPSACGSIAIGAENAPQAGARDFRVTCAGAPPSTPGYLIGGIAPDVLGTSILGVAWHVDFGATHAILPTQSDARGFASHTIPLGVSSAGLSGVFQYVWINPPDCPGVGPFSASNALSVAIR